MQGTTYNVTVERPVGDGTWLPVPTIQDWPSPSFTWEWNDGIGSMTCVLPRPSDSFTRFVDLRFGNRVTYTVFNANTGEAGLVRYVGWISTIEPSGDGGKEVISVTLQPYTTELTNDLLYNENGNSTFSFFKTLPSDMVISAIEYYRARSAAPLINYTSSSIASSTTFETFLPKSNVPLDVLNGAVDLSPAGWYWILPPTTHEVVFRAQSSTPDHRFTIGRQVTKWKLTEQFQKQANTLYFTGGMPEGANDRLFQVSSRYWREYFDTWYDKLIVESGTTPVITNLYAATEYQRSKIVFIDDARIWRKHLRSGRDADFVWRVKKAAAGNTIYCFFFVNDDASGNPDGSGGNGYVVLYQSDANLVLYKMTGGDASLSALGSQVVANNTSTHTIEVRTTATSMTVYFDGAATTATSTDTTYNSGSMGIRANAASCECEEMTIYDSSKTGEEYRNWEYFNRYWQMKNVASSTLQVVKNDSYCTLTGNTEAVAWRNETVLQDFTFLGQLYDTGLGTPGGRNGGILFRYDGATDTGYYFEVTCVNAAGTPGTGTYKFYRNVAGSYTQIASVAASPYSFIWYHLKIECVNDASGNVAMQAKVWADGSGEPTAWTLTYTDNNAAKITTAGYLGLRNYASTIRFRQMQASTGNALTYFALGRRSMKKNDERVLYAEQCSKVASAILDDYDGSQVTGTVTIPSSALHDGRGYFIESIRPGDTCILNRPGVDTSIVDDEYWYNQLLVIVKIDFSLDQAVLYFSPAHPSTLPSILTKLTRQAESFQVTDLPNKPAAT